MSIIQEEGLFSIFCIHSHTQDDDGSGELHLLLNTVFLIATCCERGSRTAQSLAGELFSLPELLWLVCLLKKYYASFTKSMSSAMMYEYYSCIISNKKGLIVCILT